MKQIHPTIYAHTPRKQNEFLLIFSDFKMYKQPNVQQPGHTESLPKKFVPFCRNKS